MFSARSDDILNNANSASSPCNITTEVVEPDAPIISTSKTTTDPPYGLLSPPSSEPRAPPYEGKDLLACPARPKQISDLPDKVLHKILSYVLVPPKRINDLVRPWYKQGMLGGYIRTGNTLQTNTGDEVTQENIDIAQTMLVCKKFAEIGQDLFYGTVWFEFVNADAFKWWYKQIGPQNLARVRAVVVNIRPGFMVDGPQRCCFDLSGEEKWLQCFRHLRSRHNLDFLDVTLGRKQLTPQQLATTQDGQDEIDKYRLLLLDELLRYRNVLWAKLTDHTKSWGSFQECNEFAEILTLKEERKTLVRPSIKRPTLGQMMEEIRLNRIHEQMVADEKHARELQASLLADDDFGFDPTPAQQFYGRGTNTMSYQPGLRQTYLSDYSSPARPTQSQKISTGAKVKGTQSQFRPEYEFFDPVKPTSSQGFNTGLNATSYQPVTQQAFDIDFPAPIRSSKSQAGKTYSRKNRRQGLRTQRS